MIPARWAVSLVVMLLSSVTANSQTQPSSSSASQTATGNWPTASPAEGGGLSDARLRSLDAAIRSGEFKKIGSVLIARHSKLAYEGYFDGDAGTLRNTRSATKSITDVLIGIAIDEHKLSGVDAKILTLLPVVEDWAQFILDLPIRGRMHVGEQVEAPPHGRYFSYCTGGVFTLSEVLEKATGMRTDHYACKKLFRPLGITNVEWVYSPMNVPQTGGGLQLTSRDLLKIAQLYLDGGEWQGKRIVSEAWVRSSTQPHARIDEATEYGYLWWLKSFKSGEKSYPAFFMTGNGGNKVVAIPALDMAVVITSTNYNTHGMHEQTDKILTDYVLAAIER